MIQDQEWKDKYIDKIRDKCFILKLGPNLTRCRCCCCRCCCRRCCCRRCCCRRRCCGAKLNYYVSSVLSRVFGIENHYST